MDLKDDKRYILLFADKKENPLLVKQQKALDEQKVAVAERDLVVKIIILSAETETQFSKYSVKKTGFTMLLIGKDGGVKLTSKTFKTPQEIFSLIDGMPMRQSEMRKRGN